MKILSRWPFLAVTSAAFFAGCQTTSPSQQTPPTGVAPVSTRKENAPDQPAAVRDVSLKTAAPASSQYRVSPIPADAPAAYVEALKKVRLAPPKVKNAVPALVRVVLNTSKGPVTIELNGKAAPMHVRSFLYLCDKKFYNNTKFHRHADLTGDGQGFIIQGGDPLSKIAAAQQFVGKGGPGYEVPLEAGNGLQHEKLVIAAARSQDPNSAGSQFYITQGATPFLDGAYTVFGKVVGGAGAALKLTQGDTLRSTKILLSKKAN